jgi:hypothetical protein
MKINMNMEFIKKSGYSVLIFLIVTVAVTEVLQEEIISLCLQEFRLEPWQEYWCSGYR